MVRDCQKILTLFKCKARKIKIKSRNISLDIKYNYSINYTQLKKYKR